MYFNLSNIPPKHDPPPPPGTPGGMDHACILP